MDVALSFILFQPSSFRLSRANTKKANVPTQPGSGNAASAWLMEQRSSLDYVRSFLSSFRFDAPRFCRDEKMASGTSKWYPIRFIPSFTVRESPCFWIFNYALRDIKIRFVFMIPKRLEICLKMTLNKLAIETFIKIYKEIRTKKFIAFQADDVSRFWNKLFVFYRECFCSFSSAFMKFYPFFI